MADPQLDTSLEGALASQPVLGPYLGMKQYLQRQQRDEQTQALQQQFLQERQNLGPNASPQDLMNLATRYADPQTLLHYGLASQDRKEATAARLQQSHELAQYRIDNLQRQREEGLARVKTNEDKLALDTWYKGEIAKHQQFQQETAAELLMFGNFSFVPCIQRQFVFIGLNTSKPFLSLALQIVDTILSQFMGLLQAGGCGLFAILRGKPIMQKRLRIGISCGKIHQILRASIRS